MPVVTHIQGREILDSRGTPALEVELTLDHSVTACASVPSGASTGSFEALELRDKDPDRFFGTGLLNAITHLENISDRLKTYPIENLLALDNVLKEMDGTDNKSRLGANTILAVSLAAGRAMALSQKQELYEYLGKGPAVLPVPLINVLNGGVHADNGLSVQEFMIVPYGFRSFRKALQAGAEIFHALKLLLKEGGFSTAVGDEGGFAPVLPNNEFALKLLLKAIKKAGYCNRRQIGLALDVAASEFCTTKYHSNETEGPHSPYKIEYLWEDEKYSTRDLINVYKDWSDRYPLISIEDGLSENDWEGWALMTKEIGGKVQLIGDDLFATNIKRLQKGLDMNVANCLLAKMNQIGTLSETKQAIETAHKGGYNCCMSHRSGETEDTSLADLAVAWGVSQVKTGSVCRGERTSKYNRFLRIEEKLGAKASFAGPQAFYHL